MRAIAAASRPLFSDLPILVRSWLPPSSFKTFASVSSSPPSDSDLRNQSRGGLPRFFSDDLPSRQGGSVRVQGSEFWHMAKVLRLKQEDRVELFNGKGGLVEGCIQSIDKTGVDFIAHEDQKVILPQGIQWQVFAAFGTLKGGRADWLIEKCTELGASSVTPLLTERSSIISKNRVDRLERVSFAAAKQCQRLHQMVLNPPIKFVTLLDHIFKSKLCLVATAEATPLLNAVNFSAKESSGLLIVGPEGDFTKKEVEMMLEAGGTAVGLGPHRLRVETATIALLATLVMWSDSQEMI
ncbi:Ribosomal RNA small subunit methyltransferase E [Arabidopsis thaliana x Arabidopsis arenosa]|uniref:Ribosomal RNA small subunit methyltransferase E n=1 Tax=Arabidopsis thaliana x Arabidopsis arenosa TaxID=1240361 RepID=A0A8T2C8N4_9BRAS|nr:Ribosomal RNA small subunit methyltransferase E [Arabidopsis thaliana x Arabidopsis arenosa]